MYVELHVLLIAWNGILLALHGGSLVDLVDLVQTLFLTIVHCMHLAMYVLLPIFNASMAYCKEQIDLKFLTIWCLVYDFMKTG